METVAVTLIFSFGFIGIMAFILCSICSNNAEDAKLRVEDEQVNKDRKIENHLRDSGYEIFGIDFMEKDYADKKAFLNLHNIEYQTAAYNHSMIGYENSSYKHSDPKDALWVRNLAAVVEAYKIYQKQLEQIRNDNLHQQALKLLEIK